MLTNLRKHELTVQAGTPMTVTGETLPRLLTGAGRPLSYFICLKISRGSGGSAPGALHQAGGRK